ncbi:hypothetical protein GCM10029992_44240 [Glycomyces albus]
MAKKKPRRLRRLVRRHLRRPQEAEPEPLTSRMRMSHAMLINLLARGGDAFAHVRTLIEDSTPTAPPNCAWPAPP